MHRRRICPHHFDDAQESPFKARHLSYDNVFVTTPIHPWLLACPFRMSLESSHGSTMSSSGITLGSQDSRLQDVSDSDSDSDFVPSETSDDRAFIASDTEKLSLSSDVDPEEDVVMMSEFYDCMDMDDQTVGGFMANLDCYGRC